jgi:glycerol kinase
LHNFKNDTEAYHYLLLQLVKQQYRSTNLVLQNSNVKQIFVDGGFSKNNIYMNLLAAHFPDKKVYAASMAQGTALGAALAIHHTWQQAPLPAQTVNLRLYKCTCDLTS